MKRIVLSYVNTFKGLSKEVWWLALISLINRAGTMVIPFLSLYLNHNLNFSKEEIALVMAFFGLGSVAGSLIGGVLTHKLGYYKVMFWSLLLTGVLFFGLQYISTLTGFCIGIFTVMTIGDTFRPAVFTALNAYSKEENKTRSVTLIRLAINLGFSVGPTLAGIIIVNIGYNGLFWIDAITCIIAGFVLLNVLHPKKARVTDSSTNTNPQPVLTDVPYLLFLVTLAIFGFVFMQLLSTIPLFYSDYHKIEEDTIGLILGLNGILILVFEMPLVKFLEARKNSDITNMVIGFVLTLLQFIVLMATQWPFPSILTAMLLVTFGEMIAFPFSNAFAMKRAKRGNFAMYMAAYSIAVSVAHITAHSYGLFSIAKHGYIYTWATMAAITAVGIGLLLLLTLLLKKEKNKLLKVA